MFLNYWPTDIGRVKGQRIIDNNIPLDDGIVKILRTI
jgi:hypothetical protein